MPAGRNTRADSSVEVAAVPELPKVTSTTPLRPENRGWELTAMPIWGAEAVADGSYTVMTEVVDAVNSGAARAPREPVSATGHSMRPRGAPAGNLMVARNLGIEA